MSRALLQIQRSAQAYFLEKALIENIIEYLQVEYGLDTFGGSKCEVVKMARLHTGGHQM